VERAAEREKPVQAVEEPRGCGRREAILDAATRLFAERGYDGTDTQALAEELQVGKGTLYRYFASKRELFLAAVDRGAHCLRRRIEESSEQAADPLERLACVIRTYLAFFAEHPEYVELLIQERALFRDRKTPTFYTNREEAIRRWQEIYRSMIAEGRLREMPVERIAHVVGDLMYGTMFTNYFTGRRKPVAEQANDILDVVFIGILSESERRRLGMNPVPTSSVEVDESAPVKGPSNP
jgi:AcrR family transcriptional regulator